MVIISLLIGFVFTPLDSTHVYMNTNGFVALHFELYNNGYFNATYNLVVRRVSAPQDLSFQMCYQNQCFLGDSQVITVEAGSRDTITLDFIGGSETGPIDVYYLVYDQHETQDRDSIEITGGVPVYETPKNSDIYLSGEYIYGKDITGVTILAKDGRIIKKIKSKNNKIYTGFLKPGIYFAIVKTKTSMKVLKLHRE